MFDIFHAMFDERSSIALRNVQYSKCDVQILDGLYSMCDVHIAMCNVRFAQSGIPIHYVRYEIFNARCAMRKEECAIFENAMYDELYDMCDV